MELRKGQGWILGLLAVLVLLVWVRALTPRRTDTSRLQSVGLPQAERAVSAVPIPTDPFLPSGWGENPFLSERSQQRSADPVGISSNAPQGFLLQGILWDPASPSAVVNNRVVQPGDHLGRWKVLEIGKDQVVLSDGVSTQILRVE